DSQVRAWDLKNQSPSPGTYRQFQGNGLWNAPEIDAVVAISIGQPGSMPPNLPHPPNTTLQVLDRRTAEPRSPPLALSGRGTVIEVACRALGRRTIAAVEPAPKVVRGPDGAPRYAPSDVKAPAILLLWDRVTGKELCEPIPVPKPATFVA